MLVHETWRYKKLRDFVMDITLGKCLTIRDLIRSQHGEPSSNIRAYAS
jgi:hypothetical protein